MFTAAAALFQVKAGVAGRRGRVGPGGGGVVNVVGRSVGGNGNERNRPARSDVSPCAVGMRHQATVTGRRRYRQAAYKRNPQEKGQAGEW